MIYLVSHPNSGFQGVIGGIDFYNGIGSTSSKDDAAKIAKTINGTYRPKFDAESIATPEASGEAKPEVKTEPTATATKPKRTRKTK